MYSATRESKPTSSSNCKASGRNCGTLQSCCQLESILASTWVAVSTALQGRCARERELITDTRAHTKHHVNQMDDPAEITWSTENVNGHTRFQSIRMHALVRRLVRFINFHAYHLLLFRTLSGLRPNYNYMFQVRAHNAAGWSEWSEIGSCQMPAQKK